MSRSATALPDAQPRLDGLAEAELARELALPCIELHRRLGSTLDRAHALGAAGAPAGTLVLALEQTAGRGRNGRTWVSDPGAGLWLTLLERPSNAAAIEVLALRLGIVVAAALDPLSSEPVRLKWPNDLYVGDGKLAGILVEARWRGGAPEWVAIGLGLNVRPPEGVSGAAGLRAEVRLVDALRAICPSLRTAAALRGPLADEELAAWRERDLAVGRRCTQPIPGRVHGISSQGELLVDAGGRLESACAGSLVLEEDA